MPLLAIGALALAQAFDYVSFLFMAARHGLDTELNPFVVHVSREFGVPGITVLKLVFITFAALAALVIARHHHRLGAAILALGVLSGFVGGISNLATL